MERAEIIDRLGDSAEYLGDDDIAYLLEVANQLEKVQPDDARKTNRDEILRACINIMLSCATQSAASAGTPEDDQCRLDARRQIRSILNLVRHNPDVRLTFQYLSDRPRHFGNGTGATPDQLETTASLAGALLHRAIGEAVQHSITDHGSTSWWDCYLARKTVVATCASLLAAQAIQDIEDL